ncbi:MAG: protein kinase [Clostridia bacterium]
MKKGDIKVDLMGTTWVLIEKLGRGGQGTVWKVQHQKTKELFAYKEYRANTNNIKENIQELINIKEFHDENGAPLNEVVLPISMVECEGESFGYIMELIDLQDFTTIKKARGANCPSYRSKCQIIKNFAKVFRILHTTYGMCYKDVNEGNILFDPKNGDIRIIDNDNIGYSNKFTIKGSNGYMAPEVILGDNPDARSDVFSFAVFVYRLLVGGYPFEGPYTEQYCIQHDILPNDARKVIYGTNALFVFHPSDKRNCLENSTDSIEQNQIKFWNNLPRSIKDMFIKTFVTNLSKDRRAERTTESEWENTFENIAKSLITCPHCGCETFSESPKCLSCWTTLPNTSVSTSSKPRHKHKVLFLVLSANEAKRKIEVYVGDNLSAEQISKNLNNRGALFKILYNNKLQKIGIKNLSQSSWTIIHSNKTKEKCEPGHIHVLETGMMIRIIPKVAQLNVIKLT